MQHTKDYSHASYYCASHKYIHTCSARKTARMQYMRVDLHAAHFVSHTCFDSSHNKNWITHACLLHVSVKLDMSCTVCTYCIVSTHNVFPIDIHSTINVCLYSVQITSSSSSTQSMNGKLQWYIQCNRGHSIMYLHIIYVHQLLYWHTLGIIVRNLST